MSWFRDGLSKEELNKEYRKLAKQYHPDLSKDPDATKKMSEINDEYDKYFTLARYTTIGYNADDIREQYRKAKEERETILAFLRRDKEANDGSFFTFNEHGKISSVGNSWDDFHGGFSLCRLTTKYEEVRHSFSYSFWRSYTNEKTVTSQTVERIPAKIEFPNYAEMYFGLQYGEFHSESTELSTINSLEKANMNKWAIYTHIYNKQYGDVWLSSESFRVGYGWSGRHISRKYAYVKCGNMIMRCGFDLNPNYYEVVEVVNGEDFGYIEFQDCTQKEFYKTHDVDYQSDFHDVMECTLLDEKGDNFYWIEDPMVAYFARRGILRFYQSKKNFRLRYGTFNARALDSHIHELSIEDAETIQDFLDELNVEFDNHVKGMIKKGRIKVKTSLDSRRYRGLW